MAYIITGASGHIGNNLVRFIRKNEPDAEITLLLRKKPKYLENLGCDFIFTDFRGADSVSKAINQGDTVIHLAALIDLSDKRQDEMQRVNYKLTAMICDICLEKNAAFIYIGSVDSIYKDGGGVINEPERYYPEKIHGGYGRTKAMAAQYVLDKINRFPDFTASIILPSAVMGINDYKPSEFGKIILSCVKGRPEFGINGGYNFVDVNDVCFSIYSAAKNRKRGQFIISGENVTVEKMYEKINRVSGRKAKPVIIPDFLVRLCAPFVKMLTPETIKSLREPHNYSCEKAEKELGLIRTPLDKTVYNTVKWFSDNRELFNNHTSHKI